MKLRRMLAGIVTFVLMVLLLGAIILVTRFGL